ncbi:sugar translocase [Acetobacter orientalis]|uniref:Sugar translocase n=1 Tax=Acetobacter orientalis TaxID=146474 RepID=A0A2Z5ZK54_9PROT|nr:sugar translocase [Acetobacter orientalis]
MIFLAVKYSQHKTRLFIERGYNSILHIVSRVGFEGPRCGVN